MHQAKGLQFTARVGELPEDVFSVVGFELTEGLSELVHGRLKMASNLPTLAAADILEQRLELTIWQNGAAIRRFTGVVSEFVRGDSGHRRTHYEVVIQPPLWRLGLMHNSRIFQNQSTDNILSTLVRERGMANALFDLQHTPPEREYCVQHRESDLAFLERLAAEEGWHFYYQHGRYQHGRYQNGSVDDQEQPALILADNHRNAPRLEAVEYNAKAGGGSRQPAVFRLRYEQRVRAAAVAMKDYTFHNPAYGLMQEHTASSLQHRDDYQHYEYPGRFKTDASGKRFTEAKLDALRNDASIASGESNRADFTCGAKVQLTRHNNEKLNQDWLITHVAHSGSQPQALEEEAGAKPTTYHNRFSAVPGNINWRPRCTHRPLMDGPQIAIVTGPDGEEIHCDQHGRVQVRFPWDQRPRTGQTESSESSGTQSSAWLRVSQGWAGGQYGFMALPRVGHEVIVSFLDGDPDQPIITGRTYHATNTPPYALPQHKTRTTLKTQTHKGEGSNELRFEDEANKEHIYIHAQKNLDLLTENNRTEVIKNDSHLTVGQNRFSHTKGNEHSTINGEQRQRIGGDCSLTTGGGHHGHFGKAQLVETGTEIHHKAGLKVVIEAGAEITLSAGGSFLKLDPGGITVFGPLVRFNSGGGPGSGSDADAQSPELPQSLDEHEPPDNDSVQLADADQRQNTKAEPVIISDLSSLDRGVKTRAAKAGHFFVPACEMDGSGECAIHDHD